MEEGVRIEAIFAALDLGETLHEVVWPDDGSGRVTIFADGEVLRVFAQPVDGARLSSVFGRRRHPVYGNLRMHTGVDFAAPLGAPVQATAPGRVSFVGQRVPAGEVIGRVGGTGTATGPNLHHEVPVDGRPSRFPTNASPKRRNRRPTIRANWHA